MGPCSLNKNTTGVVNVAIGRQVLYNTTIGRYNVAIGDQALKANTTGEKNIAIGQNALSGVNTGFYNLGIGNCAGNLITTGVCNTIVGPYSGSAGLSNTIAIRAGTQCLKVAAGSLTVNGTAVGGASAATPTALGTVYGSTTSATNNTFKISIAGNGANIDVTNNSEDLASTSFIHNILPYGSVVMWYGKRSKIPTGWVICDGTNGTPDLRNKFVIGADGDYSPTGTFQSPGSSITGIFSATGGTTQFDFSRVPAHSHLASFTGIPTSHTHGINDPGHSHLFYNLISADANNNGANGVQYGSLITPTSIEKTGITVLSTATTPYGTVTVDATGTTYSSTQIIPPFTAAYYIMKVTGVNLTT
jgi:hypothetical protein